MPTNTTPPKGYATIASMSALYGVSHRTLRFYESIGLLHPRRVGAARLYSSKDRIRLELIMKGKRFGFSLREITRLIGEEAALQPTSVHDLTSRLSKDELDQWIDKLSARRDDVQAAIAELNATLLGRGRS